MSAVTTAEGMLRQQARDVGAAKLNDAIVLPGLGITIQATATELFGRIGPRETLFIRGGTVVGIGEWDQGLVLEVVRPAAARSRFEGYGELYVRREKYGIISLTPTVMSQDMAQALLESEEARRFLPKINGLINCPVIVATGDETSIKIIGKGFDPDTGLFVTGGELPRTSNCRRLLRA